MENTLNFLQETKEKIGQVGGTRSIQSKINDFKIDLEYSLQARDLEMFDNFYKRIFGNQLIKIENVSDLDLQKKGVDKILYFNSGRKLLIDEKKRRVDFGDIAIELWHESPTMKKPGWVFNTHTDYFVYAIIPSKKCYLLPAIILKLFVKNKFDYIQKTYQKVVAQNKGYQTISYAIPPKMLLLHLREFMEYEL